MRSSTEELPCVSSDKRDCSLSPLQHWAVLALTRLPLVPDQELTEVGDRSASGFMRRTLLSTARTAQREFGEARNCK